MHKHPVYFIPGLGADHRIFTAVKVEGFETTTLHWVNPLRDESISGYAKRMALQVKHEAPVFIGLSFGGVVGAELTKLFPGSKLILLSSIASRKELPWWAKFGAAIRLNRCFSGKFMKRPNLLIRWFFTIRPGHDRALFDAILRDSDPDFLPWALHAILNWKGDGSHRIHHIHGNRDRLLPLRFTSADTVVNGGGHLMILSHGDEISAILTRFLQAM